MGRTVYPWFPRTAVLVVAILLVACQPDQRAASIESSDIEKSICSRFNSLSVVSAPFSELDQRVLDRLADLLEIDLALANQAGDRSLTARIERLIDASREGPTGKLDVSVYLRDDLSEKEIEELEGSIEDAADVSSIEYVTSREAFEEFKSLYEDQPKFYEDVPEDSLPASLRFSVNSRDDVESLKTKLGRNRDVEDVRGEGDLGRLRGVLFREMERCSVFG